VPDWKIFIKICQEELGYSPTRGLDNEHIPTDSPSAFLASLDMSNDPLQSLRMENRAWNHFHASFIAVGTEYFLLEVAVNTNLCLLYKGTQYVNNKTVLVILTGSILDWHNAIVKLCQKNKSEETRAIMNHCLVHLQESGFRDIWREYDKIQLDDGTLTLVRRQS
jgi:hypothetical protein